jgi:hypothetical protein
MTVIRHRVCQTCGRIDPMESSTGAHKTESLLNCHGPVITVEFVPRNDQGAVAENEQLRADLARVRGQRDALIEHEHVMTAEIDRLRAGGQ